MLQGAGQGRRDAQVPDEDLQRDEASRKSIDGFTDDEIAANWPNNLKQGVPFATPVFDGANEDEIKAHARSGLPDALPRSA